MVRNSKTTKKQESVFPKEVHEKYANLNQEDKGETLEEFEERTDNEFYRSVDSFEHQIHVIQDEVIELLDTIICSKWNAPLIQSEIEELLQKKEHFRHQLALLWDKHDGTNFESLYGRG
jgi:hypothetical protein